MRCCATAEDADELSGGVTDSDIGARRVLVTCGVFEQKSTPKRAVRTSGARRQTAAAKLERLLLKHESRCS